ncbi:tetratricopeptide repeat protein [Microcoleus sp. bin38.metabat.b11b12b14.051]|uniref:tetratricopeptide repeat protein n=1 Tax=Microcoleus sp. bin38.metabat.b11b12b14.051 TaxID=2742709 RepID=UPI0025EE1E0A|nr:tetratricopeptide repeat protein [Microcoleus sp. bin38.metabat.b11b12b14.051]
MAKWEESLKLYREAGDRSSEAVTLNNIGLVYSDLGEKQKSLEYFSQSLFITLGRTRQCRFPTDEIL